jgi:hypothetical protein
VTGDADLGERRGLSLAPRENDAALRGGRGRTLAEMAVCGVVVETGDGWRLDPRFERAYGAALRTWAT